MADLRQILDTAPVDNSLKHQAWDAWHKASTPDEFRSSFDAMDLPKETKRALWDAKFSGENKPAQSTPAPREGIVSRVAEDASIGWRAGEADIAHTVSNVAGKVPIPAVRAFGKQAEDYATRKQPTAQETEAHQGILDQVVQAGAQVPSQILKYAPAASAGKYAPVVGGVISAAGSLDKGPRAVVKAGFEGAAQWYGMEKAGKIQKLLPRMAASSAIQAIPAAIESGGDFKKTTAAAITGAAFGVPSAHERMTPAKAKEALKGGLDTFSALRTDVLKDFGPQHIDDPGKVSAEVLTHRLAEMHLSGSRADYAMRQAKKAFASMPEADVHNFYAAIEPGSAAAAAVHDPAWRSANPKLAKFADTIRTVLDDKRTEVTQETGKLKQFYQDYFPHIWKNPDQAAEFVRNFYAGKRPLKGSGTRFKERTVPTIADGLAAGLELAHDNPVDAVLATVRELDRFLMADRVKKDLRPMSSTNPNGLGILKFARMDDTGRLIIPKGHEEVKDPAFKVYAKNSKQIRTNKGLATPTAQGRPEFKQAGAWVAPTTVARVFNNYLSPGLSRSMIYRGARSVANTINQAQLGLSAFHAGFTSVDSAVSRFAMGVEQVVEGVRTPGKRGMVVEGAKSIASSPVAPITNAIKGYNFRKALLDPTYAAAHPQLAQMAEWFKMAGGRADVDPIYKNNLWQEMSKSFQQNRPLMGMLQLPFALIEKSAAPLMNHFVPMQKLGVFADLARFDLDKLPAGATREQQRTAVQGAWRSVDNRMGQLVYDNLMWNKTGKDLGMLAFRSIGWQLGTIREIMGGAKDWASFFNDLPRSGRRAEFTHRMAYTVALPMVVGTMGAITNKLLTGEWPDTAKYGYKDYLAPRTGHKDEYGHEERIWFPSYLKDIYHYATDPLQTVSGKVHPMFGMVTDMLHNEDFYGVEIANHNDPLMARIAERMGYAAEQLSPLSVRNAAAHEQGPDTPAWQKIGSFVGVVPAPATLKKSDAENYAAQVPAGRGQKGERSQEEAERRRALQQIKAAMRAGTDARPIIQQYVDSGIIAPGSIKKAGKSIILSTLATDIKQLDLEEALNTFEKATPAERVELLPVVKMKIRNQFRHLDQLPRNKAQRLAAKAHEIMALPVGPEDGK